MLIEVKIVIGYGVLIKVGSFVSYGVLFGEKEVNGVKEYYEWVEEFFIVLVEVCDYLRNYKVCGEKLEGVWNIMFVNYKKEFLEFVS